MGATASDSPGMSSRALRSRRSLRREVDRLTALADENQTRLLERERELEEQQRILRNLNARQAMILRMEREVAGSRNPFHAAEAAAGAARMVSGARRVAIWLLDDEGMSVRLAADADTASADRSDSKDADQTWAPSCAGLIGRALAEGQPVASTDGDELAWPLMVTNRLTGVLVLTPGPIEIDDAISDAVSTLVIHAGASIEAARLHAEQQELARRDPLTHLANRRAFDEDLAQERERSRRHANPVSLVMVDLDHFKAINDTYGHPVGDRILCEVADSARRALRGSDSAYRLGGEEFAVIARDTDIGGALVLAERLRSHIESTILAECGDDLTITASLGVAELGSGHHDIGQLVAAADAAMYAAKRSGRNRVAGRPSTPLAPVG